MKTRCRGCRTLIDFRTTYCDDCKTKKNKECKESLKDKEAEKLLKTQKWQSLRKDILRRDKCCVPCFLNGFIEYRGLQVHHIKKRTSNPELAYDSSNLVTICRTCHEEYELLSPEEQLKRLGDFNKQEEFTYL